ncbi:MAG: hypothetical protein L6262_07900 [Weeksellaceae bacterium]|nr:hypothetical protein [Weeksellaceae bacterium]
MRKLAFLLLLCVIFFSCSKNKPVFNNSDAPPSSPITYDTTAIDSFGPGATSESVMAKINAVAIKRKKDSLAAIAKIEQEKLEKEKLEKEKAAQKEKQKPEQNKPEEQPTTETPAATPQENHQNF